MQKQNMWHCGKQLLFRLPFGDLINKTETLII